MLEDRVLVWKIKNGNSEALCRVYQKYKRDMLSVANALLHDLNAGEDVVHDVFIGFVRSVKEFKLTGSLKGYLLRCVANLCRDKIRAKKRQLQVMNEADIEADIESPSEKLISAEQLHNLRCAIAMLPYEQREVVVLHLQAGRTFRQIARLQQASVSTIQSRYRYGLEKLKTLMNSEVKQ